MNAKDYLSQAYRLDEKINSDVEEAARLHEMATSIGSLAYGERVQTSPTGDAPFVHPTEKIELMEIQIDQEVDLLVDLKYQIRTVIAAVENKDEQLVEPIENIVEKASVSLKNEDIAYEQLGIGLLGGHNY